MKFEAKVVLMLATLAFIMFPCECVAATSSARSVVVSGSQRHVSHSRAKSTHRRAKSVAKEVIR